MRIVAVTALLLGLLPPGVALARTPAKAHAEPPASHVHAEHKPTLAEQAAQGDREAEYQYGMALLTGQGLEEETPEPAKSRKNRKKEKRHAAPKPAIGPRQALGWLVLAASQGQVAAAIQVARIFEQEGEPAFAARWWYRAGDLGDVDARTRFLDLFLAGKIDTIVGPSGATWLAARADGGDMAARLALADVYENGRGIPADLAQARRWYLSAALDRDEDAMYRLGRLDLSLPAQWRAPGKETTRDGKWTGPVVYSLRYDMPELGRAAVASDHGLDPGDLTLVRPGMVNGQAWLEAAAARDDADAQYLLGKSLWDGIDLPFDPAAIGWLEAAALQGQPQALMTVGTLAASGQGFHGADPVRAWVSFSAAADEGVGGAADARDRIAKGLAPRQLARARQIADTLKAMHPAN